MSVFDDMMEKSGLPLITEINGESVNYHVSDGAPGVAVTAVFMPDPSNMAETEPGGQSDVRTGGLLVAKSQLGSPVRTGHVVIRSDKWDIVTIDDGGHAWKLSIRRSVAVEKGAGRFRMARL